MEHIEQKDAVEPASDSEEKAKRTRVQAAMRLVGEAILETLWPTRCAVCDQPGELLCDECRQSLSYIDWWRACPRCGAPFGRVQCSECNTVIMASLEREAPPFAGLASAVVYQTAARRIVSAYKDQGERRLARTMAAIMAPFVAPNWKESLQAVTFTPATAAARRKRGFDHAELLAECVATLLDLPCVGLFQRPRSIDQRKLSRNERLANMQGRLSVLPGATPPKSMLVIDDVCTTAATLIAASDALLGAGTEDVYCLTFARTW